MNAAAPLDLAPLLNPRSVAVIGASAQGGRATGAIINLQTLGFTGAIYPVNPKYEEVRGLKCFANLEAIPGPVDLVCIGIPSEHVLSVLEEARRKGVRAAVIFASGYGEAGETGRARQCELEEFAARAGMAICGPNCLGVLNFNARSCGYSSTSPAGVKAGDVALVSQSGTIVVAMIRSLRSIGFSHMISSGNEAVVNSADYIRYLVDQPEVRVIASFVEGVKEPCKFLAAADQAYQAGKPIVLMKAGRSEEGSAASAAHTGMLAGSYAVQSAIFRQKGIVHCEDLDTWLETIEMFRIARPVNGGGIGMIGISGGENAVVVDQAREIGLEFPPLSSTGREKLAKLLPWYGRPENPIDPTGSNAGNEDAYVKCIGILAAEPHLDMILVSQDSPAAFDLPVAKATVEAAKHIDKCIVFFNNFSGPWNPEIVQMLRDAGVPYLQGVRETMSAVKAFIEYHARRRQVQRSTRAHPTGASKVAAQALKILTEGGPVVTEDVSKRLLALYDLPVTPEIVANSAAEASDAASKLGYPVVAKIVSPDLPHKAAAGGVRLHLSSAEALERAYAEMVAEVKRMQPMARIAGVLIQPMIKGGLEVILGVKRDPQFGPVVMFGLGGIFVEALRQVSFRLAPFDAREARAMIDEVPAFGRLVTKLYAGHDAAALLVPLLLRLSQLATEIGDAVEEIDINPAILDPASGTAVIVDALITRRQT
jgi:acyl-CoA synthetase (NDP forming)